MDDTTLFTAALQLEDPWKVTKVELLGDEAGSFLHAKLPIVHDGAGRLLTAQPPWAKKGPGFTPLVDA